MPMFFGNGLFGQWTGQWQPGQGSGTYEERTAILPLESWAGDTGVPVSGSVCMSNDVDVWVLEAAENYQDDISGVQLGVTIEDLPLEMLMPLPAFPDPNFDFDLYEPGEFWFQTGPPDNLSLEVFPTVAAIATTTSTIAGTVATITLPNGIASGDRVLIFAGSNTAALTPAAGWTLVGSNTNSLGGNFAHLFYRDCDGTEGTSVSFTKASGDSWTAHALLFVAGTFDATVAPEFFGTDTIANHTTYTGLWSAPTWQQSKTAHFVFAEMTGTTVPTAPATTQGGKYATLATNNTNVSTYLGVKYTEQGAETAQGTSANGTWVDILAALKGYSPSTTEGAAPTIVSITTGNLSVTGRPQSFPIPSGCQPGDKLIYLINGNGYPTVGEAILDTVPLGWSVSQQVEAAGVNGLEPFILWRNCNGEESGSVTVRFTSSATLINYAAIIVRGADELTGIEYSRAVNSASSATRTPPPITAYNHAGAQPALYITMVSHGNATTTVSSYPANFPDNNTLVSGVAGAFAFATATTTSLTVTPGPFVMSVAAAYSAITIALMAESASSIGASVDDITPPCFPADMDLEDEPLQGGWACGPLEEFQDEGEALDRSTPDTMDLEDEPAPADWQLGPLNDFELAIDNNNQSVPDYLEPDTVDFDGGTQSEPPLIDALDIVCYPPTIGNIAITPAATIAGTTLTVSLPTGTSAGDVVIIMAAAENPSNAPAAPAGWTSIGATTNAGIAQRSVYRILDGTEGSTVNFTIVAGDYAAIAVAASVQDGVVNVDFGTGQTINAPVAFAPYIGLAISLSMNELATAFGGARTGWTLLGEDTTLAVNGNLSVAAQYRQVYFDNSTNITGVRMTWTSVTTELQSWIAVQGACLAPKNEIGTQWTSEESHEPDVDVDAYGWLSTPLEDETDQTDRATPEYLEPDDDVDTLGWQASVTVEDFPPDTDICGRSVPDDMALEDEPAPQDWQQSVVVEDFPLDGEMCWSSVPSDLEPDAEPLQDGWVAAPLEDTPANADLCSVCTPDFLDNEEGGFDSHLWTSTPPADAPTVTPTPAVVTAGALPGHWGKKPRWWLEKEAQAEAKAKKTRRRWPDVVEPKEAPPWRPQTITNQTMRPRLNAIDRDWQSKLRKAREQEDAMIAAIIAAIISGKDGSEPH